MRLAARSACSFQQARNLSRPEIGLHRSAGAADLHPASRGHAGRSRLRCRLAPQRPDRNGDFALYPVPETPKRADLARGGPLPPAPQDRELACPSDGPASYRNPMRPMPDPVPLSLRLGRDRHLLVVCSDFSLLVAEISLCYRFTACELR
jgi:hypothetical protein